MTIVSRRNHYNDIALLLHMPACACVCAYACERVCVCTCEQNQISFNISTITLCILYKYVLLIRLSILVIRQILNSLIMATFSIDNRLTSHFTKIKFRKLQFYDFSNFNNTHRYPTRHLQNTHAHTHTHTHTHAHTHTHTHTHMHTHKSCVLKCHATEGVHHKTCMSQY